MTSNNPREVSQLDFPFEDDLEPPGGGRRSSRLAELSVFIRALQVGNNQQPSQPSYYLSNSYVASKDQNQSVLNDLAAPGVKNARVSLKSHAYNAGIQVQGKPSFDNQFGDIQEESGSKSINVPEQKMNLPEKEGLILSCGEGLVDLGSDQLCTPTQRRSKALKPLSAFPGSKKEPYQRKSSSKRAGYTNMARKKSSKESSSLGIVSATKTKKKMPLGENYKSGNYLLGDPNQEGRYEDGGNDLQQQIEALQDQDDLVDLDDGDDEMSGQSDDCLSIDDVTNCSDAAGGIRKMKQEQADRADGEELNMVVKKCPEGKSNESKESEGKNTSIDAIDVDIRGGCKEEDSPTRASPVKLMDTAEKAFNEEKQSSGSPAKEEVKESTANKPMAGLENITPEEMEALKKLGGGKFSLNLRIDKPESPLDFVSARHKYPDESDIMKQKLKNMQKAEEQRKKQLALEYQRKNQQMNSIIQTTGRKTAREDGDQNADLERDMSEGERERLLQEDINAGFDPKELQEALDGWEFFKRKKVPQMMVRRYCQSLDSDYTKHKITVCAHLNHIFDLYLHQRRPYMRTLADQLEKQRSSSIGNFRQNYNNRSTLLRDQSYNYQSTTALNKLSSANQSRLNMERDSYADTSNFDSTNKKSEGKTYQNSYGVMDPNASNIVPSNPNYYRYKSEGIIYQKEEQAGPRPMDYYNSNDPGAQQMSRPIKRLYINFDKDLAHKMFGYRVRFQKQDMTGYMGTGIPSVQADQSHKPIRYYQKERVAIVSQRYARLENFQTKQTIVKVLDSDNEDDLAEIERNKRLIRTNSRTGANQGNNNPKLKKKLKTLHWVFNKITEPPESLDASPTKLSQSPQKRRFNQPPSNQKRFQSNTLRFSSKGQQPPQQQPPNQNQNSALKLGQFVQVNQMNRNSQFNFGVITEAKGGYRLVNNSMGNSTQLGQAGRLTQQQPQVAPQSATTQHSGAFFQSPQQQQFQSQYMRTLNGTEGGHYFTPSGMNPNSLQFNLNLAGISGLVDNHRHSQFQGESSGSRVYTMPNQLNSSHSANQAREKIEQQRALLIEQLSRMPQTQQAYMMFNNAVGNNQPGPQPTYFIQNGGGQIDMTQLAAALQQQNVQQVQKGVPNSTFQASRIPNTLVGDHLINKLQSTQLIPSQSPAKKGTISQRKKSQEAAELVSPEYDSRSQHIFSSKSLEKQKSSSVFAQEALIQADTSSAAQNEVKDGGPPQFSKQFNNVLHSCEDNKSADSKQDDVFSNNQEEESKVPETPNGLLQPKMIKSLQEASRGQEGFCRNQFQNINLINGPFIVVNFDAPNIQNTTVIPQQQAFDQQVDTTPQQQYQQVNSIFKMSKKSSFKKRSGQKVKQVVQNIQGFKQYPQQQSTQNLAGYSNSAQVSQQFQMQQPQNPLGFQTVQGVGYSNQDTFANHPRSVDKVASNYSIFMPSQQSTGKRPTSTTKPRSKPRSNTFVTRTEKKPHHYELRGSSNQYQSLANLQHGEMSGHQASHAGSSSSTVKQGSRKAIRNKQGQTTVGQHLQQPTFFMQSSSAMGVKSPAASGVNLDYTPTEYHHKVNGGFRSKGRGAAVGNNATANDELQSILQKNQEIENAIQMQSLQLQYIQQVQQMYKQQQSVALQKLNPQAEAASARTKNQVLENGAISYQNQQAQAAAYSMPQTQNSTLVPKRRGAPEQNDMVNMESPVKKPSASLSSQVNIKQGPTQIANGGNKAARQLGLSAQQQQTMKIMAQTAQTAGSTTDSTKNTTGSNKSNLKGEEQKITNYYQNFDQLSKQQQKQLHQQTIQKQLQHQQQLQQQQHQYSKLFTNDSTNRLKQNVALSVQKQSNSAHAKGAIYQTTTVDKANERSLKLTTFQQQRSEQDALIQQQSVSVKHGNFNFGTANSNI